MKRISTPSLRFSASALALVVVAFGLAATHVDAGTNCVPAPSGLLSWWRGEGNASDELGTNNGTLLGGATFAPGEAGQAFGFNGTDAEVDFGTTEGNFGTNDFTIEFWLKTSSGNTMYVLNKRPSPCWPSSFWSISLDISGVGAGRMTFEVCNDSVPTIYTAIN